MDKRKTIKFRLVGDGISKPRQISYTENDTTNAKVADFSGWSNSNERMRHYNQRPSRILVNLQDKPDVIDIVRRKQQRSAKRMDRRDHQTRPSFDSHQQHHKNPFMNELLTILMRYEPSTIVHYRSAVTYKLINQFNFEHDINRQASKRFKLS